MATGGNSLSKMSDETFDFVCTACYKENRTLKAVRYCVECLGYCCQECTNLHSKYPLFKGHTLLGQEAGNQQSRLPEYPTKLCRLHEGKVLDRYCEHHNEVVCEMCVLTNHRSCSLQNRVYTVRKMIGILFNLDDCNQVQSRLRDMKETMTTIELSHDSLLEALKDAKKKELEKVLNFQKGLEDIIRKGKAAEDLKNGIESKYNEVEKAILRDKQNAERNKDSINELEDKLITAKGNRADHFVCTKLAEKQMLEADSCMLTQKLNYYADIQLQFTPNQSLMNGLSCIGEVDVALKKKQDLYRIKRSKSIRIKTSAPEPGSYFPDRCYVTHDHQLLVSDAFNKNLLRFDIEKLTLIDSCKLDSIPYGICSISTQEVIVACNDNMVQFVSLKGTIATTRQVTMSHLCHGVTAWEDKYYITEHGSKLYVYDMDDHLSATISEDNAGTKLFSGANQVTFNENGKKMYVSNWEGGIVCIDDEGNHLYSITDPELLNVDGVCVDGRGNIFVVGQKSHNVVQFNEDGKKVGVVIKKADGLHRPCSVSFDPKLNRLFVGMVDNDVVKIYDLE